MSAKYPPPPALELLGLLQPARDGGMDLDFVTWAEGWLAFGQFIAAGRDLRAELDLRAALDRLDPTRHESRPEALRLLRRCADGATVDTLAAELKGLPTSVANGIRAALAGVDGELLAAAKLSPTAAAGPDEVEWSREMLPKEIAKILRISRTTFHQRRNTTKQYQWRRVGTNQMIQVALQDLPEEVREKLRPRP
jgi:hypothetical protein